MNCISLSSLIIILLCLTSHAQILTNKWTYAGGGLDPITYANNYRPPTLVSDAGSTGSANIAMAGLTMGGLGSSTWGPYEGIYSFMSTGLTLNLRATNVPAGIEQVTLGFSAAQVSYTGTSLSLNYNLANSAVASSLFGAVSLGLTNTPGGDLNMVAYTWTWTNLSLLGSSSNFSIAWNAPVQHAFITDIRLTQVVPEPSVYALLGMAVVVALIMRSKKKQSLPSV